MVVRDFMSAARQYRLGQSGGEVGEVGEVKTEIYFFMCFGALMMLFFVMCGVIEHYKPRFGHETGSTIVLGIFMSLLIYAIEGDKLADTFQFSSVVFFDFFLPPIIFNSGFCMQKKMFFRNFGNVSVFGLGVTLICFIIYSTGTIWIIKGFGVNMYDYSAINQGVVEQNPRPFEISVMQCLLYSALVCSSDVVAAVSIVDYT
jgi:sodium/hydrogen exchanger 8